MQRNIVISGRREIAPIGTEMSDRRAIGGCVTGVGRDGHRRGKVSLLPARRGFAGKRDYAKQSARRAPQVADVTAGIQRTIVKTNSGDRGASVRLERNS